MQDYASIMQQAVLKAMAQNGGTRSAPPAQNPAPSPMSAAQVQALYAHGGALHPNQCGCGSTGAGSVTTSGMPGGCAAPDSPQITCQPSIVQGNALATPMGSGTLNFSLQDCRPPAFVTCPSHKFFEIDPDTRLIFFYDFTACLFDTDPSPGSCPTSYAQPFAIQEEDGTYDIYVVLDDGTYLIEKSSFHNKPTFTLVASLPANCLKLPVKWDGTNLVFSGPVTIKDLDVNADLAVCTS